MERWECDKGQSSHENIRSSEQDNSCTTCIEQQLRVGALITIRPHVRIGENLLIECGKAEIVKDIHCSSSKINWTEVGACSIEVEQELSLQIPLIFNAEVNAKTGTVACSTHCKDESSSSSCHEWEEVEENDTYLRLRDKRQQYHESKLLELEFCSCGDNLYDDEEDED